MAGRSRPFWLGVGRSHLGGNPSEWISLHIHLPVEINVVNIYFKQNLVGIPIWKSVLYSRNNPPLG